MKNTEKSARHKMISMSYCLTLCCALVLVFCQSFSSSAAKSHKGKKTVVNTTEIGKDIRGYRGPVPVSIHITGNVIDSIVPLPNSETPRYFYRVVQSGLFKSYKGKTLKEASKITPDAVSGATYTSRAAISNIQLGIKKAIAEAETKSAKAK